MSVELHGVSETLLIPLYAQWRENRRDHPLLRDRKVDDIVGRLSPSFDKFMPSQFDRVIIILRKRVIDRIVAGHMRHNRGHAAVINLGCGLCTRFDRIDDGQVDWYDVDLGAVAPVWQAAFTGHSPRRHFVEASIDKPHCLDGIELAPETVPIVVLEGVSMYLSEDKMKALARRIAHRFPGATFVFDAMASWVALGSAFYPSIAVTGSRFSWGLDRPKSCESWGRDFRLQQDEPLARHLAAVYGLFGWFGRLNPMARSAYRVVVLRTGRPPSPAKPVDRGGHA
ncbi:class I SAM-dependent methyltransferase [Zavarzinia sp.]|uniref:class I SAM-dependent methyltransferase n=1 Tax=Zavarzinia sp. TaxID=2027920 RepID=UPI003568296A